MIPARGWVAEARRFVFANAASAIATGVDWALVTSLVLCGAHYLVAAAVGAASGAATDFSIKRYWAFDRAGRATLGREGLRYLLASATSLGLNLGAAWAMVDGFGAGAVQGVIAASMLVGVVWNYPVHRLYVFRDVPAAEPEGSGEPLGMA
jgi:putative flippase GtrA